MPWGTNPYLSPLEVRIQIGVGSLDVSVFITLLFCESVRFPAWRTASRKGILERGWRGLKKCDNWGYKITMVLSYWISNKEMKLLLLTSGVVVS